MPDGTFVRTFGLSLRGDPLGVGCDSDGAFIGSVPLLGRAIDRFGHATWRPRFAEVLNRDLGFCYGLRVDTATKAGGLAAVANDLMNDFKKSGVPAVKEVPIRIFGPNSRVVGYVDTIFSGPESRWK